MTTPSSPSKPASLWKGKSKATQEQDYDNLNPVITYRHLHSRNLGVKDPLRVIALCDSDAFYAACEQMRLGIDPSRPLVVRQWDALIAVNYPARKYGISRMDKVNDALKRCPHLVVQHVATYKEGEAEPGYWENPDTLTHKVSLDYYRRESWKIYHIFKESLGTAEIEKASIDEAFIDFTLPVREEILKRYPYLAEVPPDAPLGKDSSLPPPPPIFWDSLGTVIPVDPPPPPVPRPEPTDSEAPPKDASDNAQSEVQVSAQDSYKQRDEDSNVQEDDSLMTWHDVALSIAAELMAKVRQEIHTKLGYTMTAGIARNKFLAKLTASYKKPNNQNILRNAAIPNYLRSVPFQKIRFLGGKLGNALAEEYDVKTVGDLLAVSLEEMQSKFGEESIWVWEILRGIDRTEVKERPPITKSMLASKNLPKPIRKTSEGHHWVRVLAAELALRLCEARESIPALWPKSIVLHARQGYESMRSKQAPFPFVREITVDLIAKAGDKLWKELVGTETSRASPMKITNVQLSFTGIKSMEVGQKRIEGFFGASNSSISTSDAEPQAGDDAHDKPADAHPVGIMKHASGVKRKRTLLGADTPIQPETSTSDQTGKEAARKKSKAPWWIAERSCRNNPPDPAKQVGFTCDRCGERITLPAYEDGITSDDLKKIVYDMLERERSVHADFHLAEDLEKEAANEPKRITIRPDISGSSGAPATVKRKKSSAHNPKDKAKAKNGAGTGRKDITRFFAHGSK